MLSKSYVLKEYTQFELNAAQKRTGDQYTSGYLLVIKTDDTEIPGLTDTSSYWDLQNGIEQIVAMIDKKLWVSNGTQFKFVGKDFY